ncbi:hypothetical protein TNCV_2163471 [Trichonephila clavipes]|nr:hypothetical protein TNCV_2163471 [Trichonephila clavipes]
MGVHYLPKLQRPGCLLHKLLPYAYSALLKRRLRQGHPQIKCWTGPMKQMSPKNSFNTGSNDMLDRSNDMLDRSNDMLDGSNEIFGERATSFQSR